MSAFLLPAAKRLRLSSATSTLQSCRQCTQQRSFVVSATLRNPHTPPPPPPPGSEKTSSNDTTHFGFETVLESAKAGRVRDVFSSVASSYDTMNDLMSVGIHRLWKDHFVRSLNPGITPLLQTPDRPQRILDIAGGTGDIAFRMLDHATTINRDTSMHVTVSDINPDMLGEGRRRFAKSPYYAAGRVDFLEANAEELSAVESESIDLYTVAFGIRNFTHKEKALKEAFRVLKPGGVFACLEFAPNLSNPLFNAIYKRWSFGAIPMIGQIVANDRDSYQYLVESIERFPSQQNFARMIQEAGFLIPGQTPEEKQVGVLRTGWEDLSFGIAAIHKGVKPAAA